MVQSGQRHLQFLHVLFGLEFGSSNELLTKGRPCPPPLEVFRISSGFGFGPTRHKQYQVTGLRIVSIDSPNELFRLRQ